MRVLLSRGVSTQQDDLSTETSLHMFSRRYRVIKDLFARNLCANELAFTRKIFAKAARFARNLRENVELFAAALGFGTAGFRTFPALPSYEVFDILSAEMFRLGAVAPLS